MDFKDFTCKGDQFTASVCVDELPLGHGFAEGEWVTIEGQVIVWGKYDDDLQVEINNVYLQDNDGGLHDAQDLLDCNELVALFEQYGDVYGVWAELNAMRAEAAWDEFQDR